MRKATLMAGLAVAVVGATAHAGGKVAPMADLPTGPGTQNELRGLKAEDNVFAPFGKSLSKDFRLRTSVGVLPGPSLLGGDGRVRQRIAGSMFDFYPLGFQSGLHLSGGARYYRRVNFSQLMSDETNGLLYQPNWHSGGGGLRANPRRMTPTATVGYSSTVADKLMIGVEAGAMRGFANGAPPQALSRAMRMTGGTSPNSRSPNEIASFVVGMRF